MESGKKGTPKKQQEIPQGNDLLFQPHICFPLIGTRVLPKTILIAIPCAIMEGYARHTAGLICTELSYNVRVHFPDVTPTLETRRLWLCPLKLTDAEQAQLLFPHWEIVRFLAKSVPWPYPPDGALTFYRDVALPAVERGDSWHWTLWPKANPEQLIGAIALMRDSHENRGFWLGLPWQGQGLMSEACDEATDFWFNVLKFPALRVPKAVLNTASRRISEKQGMRVIATMEREYVSGTFPAELWEITAQEWSRRTNR